MRAPRRKLLLGPIVLQAICLALASCSGSDDTGQASSMPNESSPNIRGTYRLIERELPDGTVLTPPQFMGFTTYTETNRTFNIVGEDSMGRWFWSTAGTYTLSPAEYQETQLFSIASDPSDRAQVVYDLTTPTASSPITMTGGRLQFTGGDGVVMMFEGTRLTATREGVFVDTWERTP